MFYRGKLDQSSKPYSQGGLASRSLRRGKHPDSDSISPYDNPESSESTLSDERSILNAIRVTTPNDSSPRFYASLSQDNPVHEQGLAVNLARFVFTDSQDDHTPTNMPARQGRRQRMAGKRGNHTKLLSDQYWQVTRRLRSPLGKTASMPDSHQSLHRKAVSLDANHSSISRPRWPRRLGPVITTVKPQYPPPERTPTPPGLPSFGTSEAMSYSARFMLPDNRARSPATMQCGGPDGGQSSSSYGDTLRRFFGWSSSASHAGGISVGNIGRADDGTLVQGRFPHRQSGHGMNIGRRLHEHPFHQRLPIAHHEATDTSHDSYVEATHTKGSLWLRPSGRVRPLASPSRRHFPFPSNPAPAVVKLPVRPRATAILSLSCNLAESDSPADPVESSAQGTRAIGDHLPPNPSRLHSVFTMTVRGGADEGPHTSTPVCPDVLSWVKSQTCLCCCSDSQELDDSLGATSSRETYVTAQSQVSSAGSQSENSEENTRLHDLQAWISSLCGVMFPTLVNPAAV